MDDFLTRVTTDLVGRIKGPLHLRLVVQPLVAIVLAVRAGWRDAREGRPPYFWSLAFDSEHRRERLRQGWKDVASLFAAVTILDVVYQLVVLKYVYPGETLVVAFVLAVIPYLLVRAPVTRVLEMRGKPR